MAGRNVLFGVRVLAFYKNNNRNKLKRQVFSVGELIHKRKK